MYKIYSNNILSCIGNNQYFIIPIKDIISYFDIELVKYENTFGLYYYLKLNDVVIKGFKNSFVTSYIVKSTPYENDNIIGLLCIGQELVKHINFNYILKHHTDMYLILSQDNISKYDKSKLILKYNIHDVALSDDYDITSEQW